MAIYSVVAARARDLLEMKGCKVDFVNTVKEAMGAINSKYYDVLVIDIDLGSGKDSDGFTLQQMIRKSGKVQPIIMATGQEKELDRQIREFVDMFASGATFFHEKSRGDFLEVFLETIKHVDPIRRALYLMKDTGFADEPLHFDGEDYTIEDLLVNNGKNENILRQLRDSFYELLMEMWRNSDF